jgi:hypothetical protein
MQLCPLRRPEERIEKVSRKICEEEWRKRAVMQEWPKCTPIANGTHLGLYIFP